MERKRKRERENTLANITYLAVASGCKCLQVTAVPDPLSLKPVWTLNVKSLDDFLVGSI
jgi:hypothetical protein